LEIYADDVKCSHGATTGQLEDNALFYLRSRGLSEAQARQLLIQAFVDEVADKIEDENFRKEVKGKTEKWLQQVL
jgi:Fe-S cluster assembly protein SufD